MPPSLGAQTCDGLGTGWFFIWKILGVSHDCDEQTTDGLGISTRTFIAHRLATRSLELTMPSRGAGLPLGNSDGPATKYQ